MGQRAIKVGIFTAIGKAVGGRVQDAHQDGRGAKGQTLTMRKLPFVRFAVGHGIHLSTRYSPKPKLAWRAGWATGKRCKVSHATICKRPEIGQTWPSADYRQRHR